MIPLAPSPNVITMVGTWYWSDMCELTKISCHVFGTSTVNILHLTVMLERSTVCYIVCVSPSWLPLQMVCDMSSLIALDEFTTLSLNMSSPIAVVAYLIVSGPEFVGTNSVLVVVCLRWLLGSLRLLIGFNKNCFAGANTR